MPAESTINHSITYQDSCLWIDPIDCTRGFINGTLEDVTILIGLSFKKAPHVGIIGTPFRRN
jgi:3'-phosphoadenosine 5'-phosphosulfate (PAPS) 3'-phosphatase